ncbi:MAG: hypothetical protein ACRDGT_07590 [Candidatus Limnocylindria bacterium]
MTEANQPRYRPKLTKTPRSPDLLAAERWQFKQAYSSFQRILLGDERLAGPGEIRRSFERALSRASSARTGKK